MATFAYTGRSRAGQTVTGERIAETVEAAVSALRRDRIQVTQINPVKAKAAKPRSREARRPPPRTLPSSRASLPS